ncbi:MAG: PAS domain-containing protein, partial [Aeromicrobium sp.]|nr:PAS domain-containing protein [Burkholderiales bacterium]
ESLTAGSAGVSLLTDNEERFYWPAIAGMWQAHIGGGTPRNFGPCGDVLDCNAPLLLTHVERRYAYFESVTPPIEECLLVPFHVAGKAVGTIWAVAHDNIRKFDSEDLRLLENLGRFASAAYQSDSMGAREHRRANQTQEDAIEARLALASVNAELRTSEAFNLSIVESSLDCIKLLDLEGNLKNLLCGQAMLGIDDIEPYLNTSWFDFWGAKDRLAAEAAVTSAAAGGTGRFVGFFRTLGGEPKWWDVVISPILGADGKPERLLSVSRDVTKREQAEKNLAFLATVSGDLVLWTNIDEMMKVVAARMAAHFDLSICAFLEVDEAAEQVVVTHDWHRDDVPGLVGIYRLADFVEEEFIRLARTGEALVVCNTARDTITSKDKFAALKIGSFICMPLMRDDQWRYALCLYRSEPSDWREDEIALARELTARIWTRLERLRAEESLRVSEEQYRDLFNSMDEGLCVIEMIFDEHNKPIDYRYLEVNASFTKHSGMHDTIGKRVLEILPNIEAYWLELYGNVVLTGEPIRYKNKVEALDDRWMDVYAFRLAGPASKKVGVLFTDITERTRTADALRQSEQRFRALFDRGPIAMYSCDASGGTKEYNRVAVALWGVEPRPDDSDEQFRSAFKMYLPDGTYLPFAETPMTQVLCGKIPLVHDKQFVIERLDGTRMTIVANIVPLKDEHGEITGAINCFYDITERSLLEKKTQEQAEALADLSRRKDEFLAMLSHELRNPLAPISNAMHLLRLQKNEGPAQQQARGIIERQVGQLTHLIDDLMEVSRITTGRIHLHEEHLSLSGVAEHAIETVRPLIDKHRHSLELSMPPAPIWLHGDAARLEQVIVNLLTNAAKYTDKGGTISLSIAQEGDEAVIRVKDTGVGITPELLPRIFDLFTQADRSLDRAQGGLGIGLCLVQRLVEMHRGTVTAASTIGSGSEFVVRLPVVQHAAQLIEPSTEKPILFGKSLRILVVEDNVDAAETLTILLETSGHGVRTANDGLAALQAALEYRPHVVLLDIGLPGMDGFAVARQLREQPILANIVLVAMTGYGEVVARQKSSEAGFNHHLVKPADFRKVQEILAGISDTNVLTH